MNIFQKERIFFTLTITILSLFTYSVCDEKVKILRQAVENIIQNKCAKFEEDRFITF